MPSIRHSAVSATRAYSARFHGFADRGAVEIGLLVRGIIIGLAVAAPVGPIGLLCIRRTLEHGSLVGFATGLGAAVADGMFGAIAAFGVQFLIDWLTGHQTAIRLIGGVFMLVIAIRGFSVRRVEAAEAPDSRTVLGNFTTSLLLTLTNPMTILGFIAIFAGFGLGGHSGEAGAIILVLGVFLGSALWWLMLSSGVALIRHRISDRSFTLINRGAAVMLAGFGIYALGSAFLNVASLAAG
jgi:threonine/homoserine/homoserine lactone efflux protein